MKTLDEEYKEYHSGGTKTLGQLLCFLALAVLYSTCLLQSCNVKETWHTDKEYHFLIDNTPEGGTLDFAGDSFIVSHTAIVTKNIHFKNAGRLKREDQKTYILIGDANDSFLIVDNADGLLETDRFIVATGQTSKDCSAINVILKIKGDTIYTNTSLKGWKAGAHLYKNINFFWILSAGRYTDQSCTFENITFDGNREYNKGSYYWNLNSAVVAISSGLTTYKDCKFINSPNETIVGHNADIRNCSFYNLNGSAFHTVADRLFVKEDSIHSVIDSCQFENTNQVSRIINGHSEGAITCSLSGGYFTVTNSTFNHVGEAVMGAFYCSQNPSDWGTNNIKFTGNTIYGHDETRLVSGIDTTYAGEIRNVNIYKNDVIGIVKTDYSKQLEKYKEIKIEQ